MIWLQLLSPQRLANTILVKLNILTLSVKKLTNLLLKKSDISESVECLKWRFKVLVTSKLYNGPLNVCKLIPGIPGVSVALCDIMYAQSGSEPFVLSSSVTLPQYMR